MEFPPRRGMVAQHKETVWRKVTQWRVGPELRLLNLHFFNICRHHPTLKFKPHATDDERYVSGVDGIPLRLPWPSGVHFITCCALKAPLEKHWSEWYDKPMTDCRMHPWFPWGLQRGLWYNWASYPSVKPYWSLRCCFSVNNREQAWVAMYKLYSSVVSAGTFSEIVNHNLLSRTK